MKKALFLLAALPSLMMTACHTEQSDSYAADIGLNANEPGLQDQIFVREAFAKGQREIELGRLGVDHAANLDLRLLAQRIFDDHSRANDELLLIARQEGIAVPVEITEPEFKQLDALSGAEFDQVYLSHLMEAHQADIKKFESAARTARNPEIRAFAAKTLPALQEHRRIAGNIARLAEQGAAIEEASGAERPVESKPFYEGDAERRHQFNPPENRNTP